MNIDLVIADYFDGVRERGSASTMTTDEGNNVYLDNRDTLDRDLLGGNASLGYKDIAERGALPSRPLELPARMVHSSITEAADIIDHHTGSIIRSIVLMRRPVHAKTCPSLISKPPTQSSAGASFDSTSTGRHHASRDSIHSWHSAFNAPSSSLNSDSQHHHHRRVNSNNSSKLQQRVPCDTACDLPEKAYAVRKKICNTTYGSIRLCVVLKRVMSYVKNENGLDADHHHIQWETTDEMVAIKVTNFRRFQSLRGRHLEDPIKEMAALQQLIGNYHPHIISMLDALQNETHLFCVFPYIAKGDLYGSLVDNMASSPTARIGESLARKWFRQILSALNHLQKKGVCHRDLCLENMMVDTDNCIQIIDLGLCLRVPFEDPDNRKLVTDASSNTSRRLMKCQGQCGYLEYMAPEILNRSEVFDGFAIDMWSAGIVLFELIVGKKPFSMADPVDRNFMTISVEGDLAGLLRLKGIEVSNQAIDLLQNMMWYDPAKRLTLAEIVNHPWVRGQSDRKTVLAKDVSGGSSKWFLNSSSFDDMNGKSSNLYLEGLLESYSGLSTTESLVSTAYTSSDAETHNQYSPSSDFSMPHKSCQKISLDVQDEIELDATYKDEVKTQKKKSSWLGFPRFKRHSKATSMHRQTKSEIC